PLNPRRLRNSLRRSTRLRPPLRLCLPQRRQAPRSPSSLHLRIRRQLVRLGPKTPETKANESRRNGDGFKSCCGLRRTSASASREDSGLSRKISREAADREAHLRRSRALPFSPPVFSFSRR